MKSKLLLLLSLVFLSGCWFSPEVVVKTELSYIKILCPIQPALAGIHMRKVTPRAIFDENKIAWIGLTPNDYANLGINLQEFIRYTKGQKGHSRYYQDCISDFNAEIDRLESLEKSNE